MNGRIRAVEVRHELLVLPARFADIHGFQQPAVLVFLARACRGRGRFHCRRVRRFDGRRRLRAERFDLLVQDGDLGARGGRAPALGLQLVEQITTNRCSEEHRARGPYSDAHGHSTGKLSVEGWLAENSRRRCREAARGSDLGVNGSPFRAADRNRSQCHEIHADDELPARRLRPVHELAEEGHRGAHRLHDLVLEEAARRRASGSTAQGLDAPTQAKVVRAGKDGKPITDGVFPESKEYLAGYWIVDVDSPQRAYEIAAEASAAPGPGGAPFNMAIEVRQVMSGPPEIK